MKLKTYWKIIFIIIILIATFFISARFIGTSGLDVREYKIINKDLPKSFYGLKIVHFSDLHYGMSCDEEVLSNLVDKINLSKPDIVVFTGDLIDKDTKHTEEIENILISYLSKINSSYGNYYVSGNHDSYKSAFNSLMNKSNFISLNDSYEVINSNTLDKLFIGGIDINSSESNYLTDVLTDEYGYKILIMHYPDNFDNIKKYDFDLVLAGHSHNGQVRLPLIGSLVRIENAKKYSDAYYKIDNTEFYISGGIGNSMLNLRLFNTPSFNLYRLVDK